MEGSRVSTQKRSGGIVPLHSHRPEETVVHRHQDVERAEDRDPMHSLLRHVHIVVNLIRVSVDI